MPFCPLCLPSATRRVRGWHGGRRHNRYGRGFVHVWAGWLRVGPRVDPGGFACLRLPHSFYHAQSLPCPFSAMPNVCRACFLLLVVPNNVVWAVLSPWLLCCAAYDLPSQVLLRNGTAAPHASVHPVGCLARSSIAVRTSLLYLFVFPCPPCTPPFFLQYLKRTCQVRICPPVWQCARGVLRKGHCRPAAACLQPT